MDEDRPDFDAVIGEIEPLPALPPVRAPVGAAAGAEVDDVRVRWVDGDRLDLGDVGQALGEMCPAVVAVRPPKDPSERLRARPCRTDVDVRRRRWIGHGMSPPGRTPAGAPQGSSFPPPPR